MAYSGTKLKSIEDKLSPGSAYFEMEKPFKRYPNP
jgi:hypothetical protein